MSLFSYRFHAEGRNAVLSRTRKTRRIPSAAAEREPASTQPGAVKEPAAARNGSPPDVFGQSPSGQHREGAAPASRGSSRRALKNWRVRSRLFLLVIIPTIAAVVLGGIRISSSVQSALVYQRVVTMANLNAKIIGLAGALQREREDLIQFIMLGSQDGGRGAPASVPPNAQNPPPLIGPEIALLNLDYATSKGWADQVKSLAGSIDGSYPALAQEGAQAAVATINGLPQIRGAATSASSQLPALKVIEAYTKAINALLAFGNQIAVGSSDSALADSVRVLSLVSAMKEEASEQQAILTTALQNDLLSLGTFGTDQQKQINNALAEQNGNQQEFLNAATADQAQLFNNALNGATVAQVQAQEQAAINLAQSRTGLGTDPTIADASSGLAYMVGGLRSVEQQLMNSVIDRSSSLRTSAITSTVIDSLVVALLLAIALVSTTIIGRSMVRPLRRLRAGALEIAGLRLPETVRRMSETDGEGVSLDVEPIDVDSSDEIGEVARAFDQVHREALRLAANEAALRGNVNAMFVNLSRRSQSLVERQIRLIDDLEQGEQDPERLSSLFQMDHLATRMRRNSENLLVLAGHDESRRWNQPLALVDVLRASLSEIEHYERVTLNVQPGIVVRGQAVSDVVHLTAELIENATSFSAAETPVSIGGHLLGSGGVLLEITDEGVGMSAEEMAHANWRLDNPPVVDVAVSRRMGLFVVARLAAKHGIRVRLRPAASGGLIALVWLPDEAIMQEGLGSSPGLDPVESPETAAGTVPGADMTSGWGDTGRAAAEHEVSAARTPRFAPLRVDGGEAGLARRVPGAGPRPGADPGWVAATGPLPAFRTVPRPASESSPEPAAAGALPEAGTGGEPPAESRTADADQPAETYEPFGTGAYPVVGAGASSFDSPSVFSAPAAASDAYVDDATDYGSRSRVDGGGNGRQSDSSHEVIVPSADDLGEGNRLPIFEAVESDWFRRGRQAVGRSSGPAEKVGNGWASSSAADAGWRAAEVVHTPSSGGVTAAGLPKRVPQANLVPGTAAPAAGDGPASASTPTRSAAATRDRFSSFQRGVRRGRAAAAGDGEGEGTGGGGDEASR
jgi:signal transduction histidine kinase